MSEGAKSINICLLKKTGSRSSERSSNWASRALVKAYTWVILSILVRALSSPQRLVWQRGQVRSLKPAVGSSAGAE